MRYIKLEDLQKFPIRQDHYDKENGNEHFIYGIETVLEYAENLPTEDVVPRSEVEEMVKFKDMAYAELKSYFVEAKQEVARDMLTEMNNALYNIAMTYSKLGHNNYLAVCEVVYHRVIRPAEKKYIGE